MDVALPYARTAFTVSGRAIHLVVCVAVAGKCVILAYAAPSLFKYFISKPYKSYIKYLPGPNRRGAFASDLDLALNAVTCKESNERLAREYGLNLRLQGFGYQDQRLITYDPVTISYILGSAADRFPKPIQTRRLLSMLTSGDMFSKGLHAIESPLHYRVRKTVVPIFAPSTIRGYAPVFIHKASELCDHWRSIMSEPITPAVPGIETDSKGNTLIDINNWLCRLAFDVIGLAGLGHSFDSLRDDTNELFRAYMYLHNMVRDGVNVRTVATISWPWLEPLLRESTSKVATESAQIVRQANKIILDEMRGINLEEDSQTMLGLLLCRNADAAGGNYLTDDELLDQIDAFMFAGSDSTGLSIMWCLYELARNPEIQGVLRAELQPLGLSKNISNQASAGDSDVHMPDHAELFAAIDALPLLDRVVRESLRIHPPFQGTLRSAEQDDIVPFSLPPKMPDGSISRAVVTGLGADGVERTGIRVRKGDFIHIPFEPMNTLRDMWGEDGHTFNPDRWLDLPATAKCNPGVVPALASFSSGAHFCPAFRFAMAVMKTTIAHVVSSFALDEAEDILPHFFLSKRPLVAEQESKGFRLPLRVRKI